MPLHQHKRAFTHPTVRMYHRYRSRLQLVQRSLPPPRSNNSSHKHTASIRLAICRQALPSKVYIIITHFYCFYIIAVFLIIRLIFLTQNSVAPIELEPVGTGTASKRASRRGSIRSVLLGEGLFVKAGEEVCFYTILLACSYICVWQHPFCVCVFSNYRLRAFYRWRVC